MKALLFLATLLACAAPARAGKPNVVILYADHLGYGDTQCYNPERGKIPTPNIDRLASQGMRFTDAPSSSGVFSPSRYTLLTGSYHWRTRLQNGIVGVFGEPLIAPDRLTLADLAKQHGSARTATASSPSSEAKSDPSGKTPSSARRAGSRPCVPARGNSSPAPAPAPAAGTKETTTSRSSSTTSPTISAKPKTSPVRTRK